MQYLGGSDGGSEHDCECENEFGSVDGSVGESECEVCESE